MERRSSGLVVPAPGEWIPPDLSPQELSESKTLIREFLRLDSYDRQDEMYDAIDTHRKVAIAGAHAVGKTYGLAAYALIYLQSYDDAIVLTTAPTWEQVKRQLWGNIKKHMRRVNMTFPRMFELEVGFNESNYMIGLSTNEGVRFQGFHSGHMLILFDEAPGVREDIWLAADGAAAGGAITQVALGNPTLGSGRFHDAFEEGSPWHTIRISAFDTPNLWCKDEERPYTIDELLQMPEVELDVAPYPELVTRRWVRDMYREHGPDSPEWESRVMARFPRQAADALFPLPWLREAQRLGRRHLEDAAPFILGLVMGADLDGAWTAGIDVAGEGADETVVGVCQRVGGSTVIQAIGRWGLADAFQQVLDFLEPYKERLCRPGRHQAVRVDTAGIGQNFARRLEEHGYLGHVADVNVAWSADEFLAPHRLKERAEAKRRFDNLKARLYWECREKFRKGTIIGVALDQEAVSQLAGLRYRSNEATGRLEVETKKALKKRGVKSPDIADTLVLATADLIGRPIPAAVSATVAHRSRGR